MKVISTYFLLIKTVPMYLYFSSPDESTIHFSMRTRSIQVTSHLGISNMMFLQYPEVSTKPVDGASENYNPTSSTPQIGNHSFTNKQLLFRYSRKVSRPGSNGCCGFFRLFGRAVKVILSKVSPVSVAGIFRGQHSVLWCSVFMAVR